MCAKIVALRGNHNIALENEASNLREVDVNSMELIRPCSVGTIIGRLCRPRGELTTWTRMKNKSAIRELLECNFESIPKMQVYRASDRLIEHKMHIEDPVFESVQSLFGFTATSTLQDLTNTYLDVRGAKNEQASYGRLKEKRFDCPLVDTGKNA